jgi:lipopolysaccharide transport protein LptA
MVSFYPKRQSSLAGALIAVWLGALATAQTPSRDQRISVEAAHWEGDYRKGTVAFREVVIKQGDMTVEAERAEATGLNFDNSRWTFDGNVRIRAQQRGSLRSDKAIVEFRDNRITRASVTGVPAEFEQRRSDSNQMARGHARSIEYTVQDGTIRLTEDAWLSDGRNEITGSLLVYNIKDERVQAEAQPGTKERVRITIIPGEDGKKSIVLPGGSESPGNTQSDANRQPQPKSGTQDRNP